MIKCYVFLWRWNIYAVIETGGKQYIASPGKTINVELLDAPEGEKVELENVLLISDDNKVTIGKPYVKGAKVVATSSGSFKDKKVTIFKYKPKTRHNVKTGHRQTLTKLTIDKIVKSTRKPKAKVEAEATEEVKKNGS